MGGGSAYLGPQSQSLEQTPLNYIYIQIYFQAGKWTNEIAKPSISQNLQSEMETCNRNRKL